MLHDLSQGRLSADLRRAKLECSSLVDGCAYNSRIDRFLNRQALTVIIDSSGRLIECIRPPQGKPDDPHTLPSGPSVVSRKLTR